MNNKILIFQDDDEFIEFAINVTPVITMSTDGHSFYDFDYSPAYMDCIKNNKQFNILDELSNIKKRKELNYRLIVKPISNLV